IVARLQARYPRLPDGVWERLSVSPPPVAGAHGPMGAGVTAPGGAGRGGRGGPLSPRPARAGFGGPAVGHVAQALAVGGYAPGVVTAPVVAAPFSVWAWRRLRAAGVPAALGRSSAWGMVLLPVTLGAVHLAAHRLTRRTGAMGDARSRSR